MISIKNGSEAVRIGPTFFVLKILAKPGDEKKKIENLSTLEAFHFFSSVKWVTEKHSLVFCFTSIRSSGFSVLKTMNKNNL